MPGTKLGTSVEGGEFSREEQNMASRPCSERRTHVPSFKKGRRVIAPALRNTVGKVHGRDDWLSGALWEVFLFPLSGLF